MQLSQSPNLQLRTPPRSGLPITENEARAHIMCALSFSASLRNYSLLLLGAGMELASNAKRVQKTIPSSAARIELLPDAIVTLIWPIGVLALCRVGIRFLTTCVG